MWLTIAISPDAGEISADIKTPTVDQNAKKSENMQQEITPMEPLELAVLQKDGTSAEVQEGPIPYYQEASNTFLNGWRLYILTFG